jgi:hypothetical protein
MYFFTFIAFAMELTVHCSQAGFGIVGLVKGFNVNL